MRHILIALILLLPLTAAADDLVVFPFVGTMGGRGLLDAVGPNARFRSPRGIAAAADGSLYVTDAQNHALRRIDANGRVTTLAASFEWPEGVAVDRGGKVYVSDQIRGTVNVVSAGGSVIPLASGFSKPCGLAADDSGNVYVADAERGTVSRISASRTVTTFLSHLDSPFALALARDGTLYVGTLGGSLLTPSRTIAEGLGEIAGVAVAGDGTLLVTDRLAGTAQRITPQGNILIAAKLEQPVGIAVAGDQVLVAESLGAVVNRLGVGEIAGARPEQGTNDGGANRPRFISPVSLAMNANGELLVADIGAGSVRRVTNGSYVFTIARGLAETRAVTADAAGNIYVAAGDQVQRLGDSVSTLGVFRSPSALAIDPNGNLIVADNDGIRRLDGRPIANLRNVRSMAFDGFGNLYAADGAAVRRVTPDGSIAAVKGPFVTPYGVTVDRHGNLWVADPTAHAVWILDRSGNLGASYQNFDQPVAVATDGLGNVFIADAASHAIRIAGLRGDVNGDYSVDAGDVATLQRYLVDKNTPITRWADVNLDGSINAADLEALLRILGVRRRTIAGR